MDRGERGRIDIDEVGQKRRYSAQGMTWKREAPLVFNRQPSTPSSRYNLAALRGENPTVPGLLLIIDHPQVSPRQSVNF
jgi:hypothetical protein